MKLLVRSAPMHGVLRPPPAKSVSLRAAALAAACSGESILHNFGESDDELLILTLLPALGAHVQQEATTLRIRSEGLRPIRHELPCGESALALRLFACLSALLDHPMRLQADEGLCARPQHPLEEILGSLDVSVQSTDGHAPLLIHGPLRLRNIVFDASLQLPIRQRIAHNICRGWR